MKSLSIAGKSRDYTYMNFGKNDKGANRLFEFLAENTDVEWAIFQKDMGFQKNTEIFTSHLHNREVVGASLLSKNPEGLIYHIHSHPKTNKMGDYSRLSPSDADKSFARRIRRKIPNAKFYIYFNYRKLSY